MGTVMNASCRRCGGRDMSTSNSKHTDRLAARLSGTAGTASMKNGSLH